MKLFPRSLPLLLALAAPTFAFAHVSFESGTVEPGASLRAVLRVSHGCDKAATTGITVRLPSGFDAAKPEPKAGWNIETKPGIVTWTAGSSDAALPDGQRGEFTFTAIAPRSPSAHWFKVLQSCGKSSLDWSEIPAQGTSTAGMKQPAALLQVLSPTEFAQAGNLPRIEGAWVRSSVAGQQGTGAFMRITAPKPMQLVGVSTPVAGVAEVHEMKMQGDVMLMRPVGKLDLPAGQTVELKPGGYHLMLMDLKQPLARDSVVPMTLVLRDAKGRETRMELKLPVDVRAPAGAASAPASHKH